MGGWFMGTLLVGAKEGLHQCSQRQERADGNARERMGRKSPRSGGGSGGSQIGSSARHGPMLPPGQQDDEVVGAAGRAQGHHGESLAHERMGRVRDGDLLRCRIYL